MAILIHFLSYLVWIVGGFMFASLVEYCLHRLMHIFPKLCEFHVKHHQLNNGQGVAGEFWDYFRGALIFMIPLFVVSWQIGLCWFLGAFGYAIFAAFAHQVQHENPASCFWMPMPVHYVHHEYGQWKHNFGLGVDWWDRLFGTYLPTEWLGEKEKSLNTKSVWAVKWL